jgi:hypothetical protein
VGEADRTPCEDTVYFRVFKTQHEKHWFSHELFLAILRLRVVEANGASGYAEAFYCRKLLLELGLSMKMEPTDLWLDQK